MTPEPPNDLKTAIHSDAMHRPYGLAAMAGALADWDDLDEAVQKIYADRRYSRDSLAPDLG
jgi:hypothetical protein